MKFRTRLRRFLRTESSQTVERAVVERFVADSGFPFLVSFPRTGSHWLRALMELTFETPALVRTFYYHGASDYTCLHHHDLELEVRRNSVIYMWREPVATIYSQLRYHEQDVDDLLFIRYWANIYGLHLRKWLLDEDFTEHKTVLRYEELKEDPCAVLGSVGAHLGLGVDLERVDFALEQASKSRLEQKTKHDPQVINRGPDYQAAREAFFERHSRLVIDCVLTQDNRLEGLVT